MQITRRFALLSGLSVGASSSLQVPDPVASDAEQWKAEYASQSLRLHDGAVLPYRLMRPSRGYQDDGPKPLILLLHGSGAIGSDNEAQLGPIACAWAQRKLAAGLDAYVVAPQVPSRSADYATDDDGLPFSGPGPSFPCLEALLRHLASALPIDSSRRCVMGFSMGGSTCLQLIQKFPQAFTAGIAIAPVPPARSTAVVARDTAVMLVHGELDVENPVSATLAWAKTLATLGAPYELRLYPGVAHEPPPDFLASQDWQNWLLGQRTPISQVCWTDSRATAVTRI